MGGSTPHGLDTPPRHERYSELMRHPAPDIAAARAVVESILAPKILEPRQRKLSVSYSVLDQGLTAACDRRQSASRLSQGSPNLSLRHSALKPKGKKQAQAAASEASFRLPGFQCFHLLSSGLRSPMHARAYWSRNASVRRARDQMGDF